jgi:selenocysteine lyase/cysteine desulfurase
LKNEDLLREKNLNFSHQDESVPYNGLMRLGFTRLNLSYFASDEEVDYLLNALEFIAEEGWRFLSLVRKNSLFYFTKNAVF